ncbi:phosphatidate cytidylyltransferase [Aliamphritea hakodatensis]|uniref:phosphatidate cytidylyltransferase n=1 Tax=Aliamphritea hakodatensis TaxID=2895352 RepID=UPI0022FD3F5A|nr:phosphatidate cytidylyltransferase [Aliamphritea hakodatensis]
MLKQRLITALILAPCALAGLFFLSFDLFKLFTCVIVLFAAWEWADLSGVPSASARVAYSSFVAACIALVDYSLPVEYFKDFMLPTVLFWVMALFWVLRFPVVRGWQSSWQRMIIGLLVLVPSWMALVSIRQHPDGSVFLLMLLLLVWGADIGAYFAGKTWGRKKLAPKVSPGKTMAGFWGGIGSCVLIAVGFVVYLDFSVLDGFYLIVLSVVAGLASVLGDLFESMLKRQRGIKDSSKLLPGHGGVLDRIDSITAAAPMFVLGVHVLTTV